jgi:hypothetical protein
MSSLKPETHSFIIKFWLEETDEGKKPFAWRGHITHVPGGERSYLSNILNILSFIKPYLKNMGADIYQGLRARRRLMLWTLRK